MRVSRAVALMAAVVAVAACQEKKQEAPPAATQPQGQTAAPAPGGGGGGPAGDKILIGHVGSMTGNEATFGDSTDKGIKLAVDEQNKKGGVKGKQLVVKTLDDQGKPEEAAVAATRLVTQDGARCSSARWRRAARSPWRRSRTGTRCR